MKISKHFKRIASLLVLLIAIPLFLYFLLDYLPRYLSWYSLSTQEIKEKAQIYAKNFPVCLYIVECSSGEPRLTLVSNIEKLDIAELKQLIWKRRFYKYCEGYTENLVLDFPVKVKQSISDARWSFYNDRFITNHGHFQGSYVSQFPWEQCTESTAILGNKN
jgi:hypothetical protein